MSNYKNNRNALKHGMWGTRFYGIWKAINGRCYRESDGSFINYGARGITSIWKNDFFKFKNEMYSSYLEHCVTFGEKNTTIERINNNGNYSLGNCRWTTMTEQARNRRSNRFIEHNGKRMLLIEWAEYLNLSKATLSNRIQRGWPLELALKEI